MSLLVAAYGSDSDGGEEEEETTTTTTDAKKEGSGAVDSDFGSSYDADFGAPLNLFSTAHLEVEEEEEEKAKLPTVDFNNVARLTEHQYADHCKCAFCEDVRYKKVHWRQVELEKKPQEPGMGRGRGRGFQLPPPPLEKKPLAKPVAVTVSKAQFQAAPLQETQKKKKGRELEVNVDRLFRNKGLSSAYDSVYHCGDKEVSAEDVLGKSKKARR